MLSSPSDRDSISATAFSISAELTDPVVVALAASSAGFRIPAA
jgi:hypothetical protein